jgi:hypothetical protein
VHRDVPACRLGYLTRQEVSLKLAKALKLSLQFVHKFTPLLSVSLFGDVHVPAVAGKQMVFRLMNTALPWHTIISSHHIYPPSRLA